MYTYISMYENGYLSMFDGNLFDDNFKSNRYEIWYTYC